jgi:hypothetical protein
MAGKVGTAECYECYIRFPKTQMSQKEVRGSRSGVGLSFGKKGNVRVYSGRQIYRKAWVCGGCRGGSGGFFESLCRLIVIAVVGMILWNMDW